MADDFDDWRGDFESAEERMLEASLAATPSQRLKWLEEALAFAARVGALEHIAPGDGAAVDGAPRPQLSATSTGFKLRAVARQLQSHGDTATDDVARRGS